MKLYLLALATLGLMAIGCSNAERESKVAMRLDCLERLGQTYRAYFDQEGHCPGGVEDLTKFMESGELDEVGVEAVKRLRERDIQMFWDETLTDASVFADQYVLGFEPSCMGAGGYIVTGGGRVDHVTGKRFQTAKYLPTKDNAKQ